MLNLIMYTLVFIVLNLFFDSAIGVFIGGVIKQVLSFGVSFIITLVVAVYVEKKTH